MYYTHAITKSEYLVNFVISLISLGTCKKHLLLGQENVTIIKYSMAMAIGCLFHEHAYVQVFSAHFVS